MDKKKFRFWTWFGFFIFLTLLFTVGGCILAAKLSPFFEEWKNYGYLGLFLIYSLGNATIVVPILPVVGFSMTFTVELARQTDPLSVAIVAAFGATLGESVSYLYGRTGRRLFAFKREDNHYYQSFAGFSSRIGSWFLGIGNWFLRKRWVHWLSVKVKKHKGLAIFILALQPILPFDAIGIIAGSIKYPVLKFMLLCFSGRTIKYWIMIIGISWGIDIWNVFWNFLFG